MSTCAQNIKRCLGVVFCLILLASFIKQDYKQIGSIKIKPEANFEVDNLGNVYVFCQNELIKYDFASGQQLRFSRNDLGNIASVDVSNPLKILLFYKDFQVVLFLDINLTLTGDILNMTDYNIYQPLMVCSSVNNGFWVYEAENNTLVQFNHQNKIINKSVFLNRIFDDVAHLTDLTENNNRVYVSDSQAGLHVFDRYAAYIKTIPIKNIKNIQLQGDKIFYHHQDVIYSYNIRNFATDSVKLPNTQIISFWVARKKLYIKQKEQLAIYDIEIKEENKK